MSINILTNILMIGSNNFNVCTVNFAV